MKKVLIINQGFTQNIGDKAISFALKRFFEEKGYTVITAGYAYSYRKRDISEPKDKCLIDNKEDSNTTLSQMCKFLKEIKENLLNNSIGQLLSYIKISRKRLKNHINEVSDEYDLAIIGGGQLIKNNNLFPFAFKDWSRFLINHANKIAVVGVGVNPNFSNLEKFIYKKYLKY